VLFGLQKFTTIPKVSTMGRCTYFWVFSLSIFDYLIAVVGFGVPLAISITRI